MTTNPNPIAQSLLTQQHHHLEAAAEPIAEVKAMPSNHKAQARARIQRTVNPSVTRAITADVVMHVATYIKDNPSPGACGMIITTADGTFEESDYYDADGMTGPLLDLEAMIAALNVISNLPGSVAIHTTTKSIVEYLNNGQAQTWRANGWCKSSGEPIKNAESWAELVHLYEERRPMLAWLAHRGDPTMKRSDELAELTFRTRKPVSQND